MIASTSPRPRFRIGQLVQHRRYGYRGVVVHLDPFCKAPDGWYYANQTQPNRNQPWYHVLVDGRDSVTYAAESSLAEDDRPAPIDNPLVPTYFKRLSNGAYARNDRPWEGSW